MKRARNRVVPPKEGTVRFQIWQISNDCYAMGARKLRAAVLAKCQEVGIHKRTASAEHCIWRRYVGLVA